MTKHLEYNWYYTSDIYYLLCHKILEIREYRPVIRGTIVKAVCAISIVFENNSEVVLTSSFKRTDDREERGTICFSPLFIQTDLDVTHYRVIDFHGHNVSIASVFDDQYCVDVGLRLKSEARHITIACASMPGSVTAQSNFIDFPTFDPEYPEDTFIFREMEP